MEWIKQKEKERQIEVDRVHLAAEEKEKDRQFEFEKHKCEMEKLGVQQRLQEQGARVKSESDKTEEGVEIITGKGLAKVPRIVYFDNI